MRRLSRPQTPTIADRRPSGKPGAVRVGAVQPAVMGYNSSVPKPFDARQLAEYQRLLAQPTWLQRQPKSRRILMWLLAACIWPAAGVGMVVALAGGPWLLAWTCSMALAGAVWFIPIFKPALGAASAAAQMPSLESDAQLLASRRHPFRSM